MGTPLVIMVVSDEGDPAMGVGPGWYTPVEASGGDLTWFNSNSLIEALRPSMF